MTWAIVPVKRLSSAKTRLAGVLTLSQRERLMVAMVSDLLDELAAARRIAAIVVISPDPLIAALVRRRGHHMLVQHENTGYAASANEAIDRVVAWSVTASVMVLPADLPMVTGADIDDVLAPGVGNRSCRIIPADDDLGTNCLILSPPGAVPCLFGPDSFARHCAAARDRRLSLDIVRHPRFGRDLDRPGDLHALDPDACGSAMRQVLPMLPRLPGISPPPDLGIAP